MEMTTRRHDWDAVRAAVMLLGIPFHASLIYHTKAEWIVSSPDPSLAVTLIGELLTSFRMPVFFMVAGYFSVMLLQRRGPAPWFKSRLLRLGLPLVSAAILLNPLQMVAAAYASGDPDPGALIVRDLTSFGSHWIEHLWFLIALLVYSAGLAVLWRFRFTPPRLTLWAAMAASAVYLIGVMGAFYIAERVGYEAPLGGVLDFRAWLIRLPFFVFGASCSHLLTGATKLDVLLASAATAGAAIMNLIGSLPAKAAGVLLSTLAAYMVAKVSVTYAERWFSRPNRPVRSLVDASFTVYLVHQPVIALLGVAFLAVSLPPAVEFVGIVLVTAGVSYAAHLGVRSSPVLLLLFNGEPRRRSPGAVASA